MENKFILAIYGFIFTSIFPYPGHTQETWISEKNFDVRPNYVNKSELEYSDIENHCKLDKACEKIILNNTIYYKSISIDDANYEKLILGMWTGGRCTDDFWSMSKDMTFNSQYPIEDGIYARSGTYSFKNGIYSEIATNAETGLPEISSARIFYLPALNRLIYKGIPKETYPDRQDYFYFDQCK